MKYRSLNVPKKSCGLGIASFGDKVLLFYNFITNDGTFFRIDSSKDGISFNSFCRNPQIISEKNQKEDTQKCSDFRISPLNNKYFLTYKQSVGKKTNLCCATSTNLTYWEKIGNVPAVKETGMIAPSYRFKGSYVMFYGEDEINIAYSKDLRRWSKSKSPVLKPDDGFLGKSKLKIGNVIAAKEGILLTYFVIEGKNGVSRYSLNAALFDKRNPERLLWESEKSIWEQTEEWTDKKVSPLGVTDLNGRLLSYWEIEGVGIFSIVHFPIQQVLSEEKPSAFFYLKRVKENPILKPNPFHFWESKATFNPAAVYESGKVHLIYRAVGDQDMSMLGYAASSDGIHIDERLDQPVYVPSQPFEYTGKFQPLCSYTPGSYASGGGGYGGCEDPRITKVGNRFYMTYVAFDGGNPPRVALTSIDKGDFLNKKWNWEKSVLISPPGVVDKNACIFPEKINGKYVIFHRIFPNILIDFVDDLNFDGRTRFLHGEYKISPTKFGWDSRKIGAGAPPIKTKYGWLLIYHAVGEADSSRYKMGAMLLDLKDPTNVLARSNKPILEPETSYENEGYKYGVAYPCGAVDLNGQLIVYYGGADMVTCAATANLDQFLDQLVSSGSADLRSVRM